jgi:hypothetical protein
MSVVLCRGLVSRSLHRGEGYLLGEAVVLALNLSTLVDEGEAGNNMNARPLYGRREISSWYWR